MSRALFWSLVLVTSVAACDDTTPEGGDDSTIGQAGSGDPSTVEGPGDGDDVGSGTASTDTDAGTGTGATTVPEPISVDSLWQVEQREMTLDECNSSDWLDEQDLGTVELIGTRADGFVLLHDRGEEDCTFRSADGRDYTCTRRLYEDPKVIEDFGIDAMLINDVWVSGEVIDGEWLAMTTQVITTCDGDDCWLAALTAGGFPCASTIEVEAVPL